MSNPDRDGIVQKMVELCPEIEQLGIYPIVLPKGKHY
jgi:hypothetical protein